MAIGVDYDSHASRYSCSTYPSDEGGRLSAFLAQTYRARLASNAFVGDIDIVVVRCEINAGLAT